jgi:hypothetical protein
MYLVIYKALGLGFFMPANPLLGQLALEMYLPASKSLRPAPFAQQVQSVNSFNTDDIIKLKTFTKN